MLLRWLFHLLGIDDVPDPAWRPTGYRQTTDTTHDEARAAAAVKRSAEVAEARRRMAARRAAPRPEADEADEARR